MKETIMREDSCKVGKKEGVKEKVREKKRSNRREDKQKKTDEAKERNIGNEGRERNLRRKGLKKGRKDKEIKDGKPCVRVELVVKSVFPLRYIHPEQWSLETRDAAPLVDGSVDYMSPDPTVMETDLVNGL